ncbi:MAG: NAD(P)H-dependent glycerol-3-phosphate dehydrogenase [Nitrospira sp.]|jgi:glycerol-3-phosphate dehydrogenase (NAD(P)+)|nr:NAD(P)-dependent glycerol-3-phosphate dehydrogenase [Nitrospira sp.]MBP6605891.1 NAD(P)-dependent glycerol-3-phosphate dehydrogenase [Nitrospira sp.]HQY56320.1 NAD(P)H-dependent glycerol-3-phosphate dehydrogenase [Nitrospira sp.]HRA95947.1 NAD(P)H-dependent glycerol-3-phosphate dehydrogenase [Nitrospira sp.]
MRAVVQHVAVIGAGAWGTALARHLAEKQVPVCLWAHEPEVVQAIQLRRENAVYLPGVLLPPTLSATNVLADAITGADCLIFAVPSHVARPVLSRIATLLPQPIPFVSATKGIEEETLALVTQVMQAVLPAHMHESLLVLSGPSFASEVSRGKPTALCLAGRDAGMVKSIQSLFMTPNFRVYADDDLIGVQLGGALKNVMALAAGVVDGLELGHNARAALMTRGLAEMIRLGVAMGADPRTFYGLSGVGDLILTCTGPLSRNHSVGVRLGKGERLEGILASMQAVAEGVRTAKAALGLALRCGVDMPIVQEVNAVLFADKPCRQAVGDLMEREAKGEKGLS